MEAVNLLMRLLVLGLLPLFYTHTAYAADASCTITGLRLGGEPGDQYIGPTCDGDGTYRTCLYLSGQDLSSNSAEYSITVDGVAYAAAFLQVISSQQVVVCVTGVPGDGTEDVDVTVEAGSDCSYTATALLDEPMCTCDITAIRLGGQPGDQYIGPTCDNDGTYRTCLYVSGSFLPASAAAYAITIDGVAYSAAFLQVINSQQVVVCVTGVPGGGTEAVDVSVEAGSDCSYTATALLDEPMCTCDITAIRLGGQPGDQYIGPTCDNDGTYRTCLYVSGSFLPTDAADYAITIDGVAYSAAFLQVISSQQVVVCVTGVPGDGTEDVDVTVEAGSDCSYTATALLDEPMCTCDITAIRLGGQPGDQYIGPTCDNDGTYRTCLYVSGSFLPTNAADYAITIDGVAYSAAFLQVISSQQVVVCVTGVPGDGTEAVDVTVEAGSDCSYTATALLNEPMCTCDITAIRLGGQPGDQYIGPTCDNDGTYRTCLYVSGSFLPTDATDYQVSIDGVVYPVAFTQVIGTQQVVVCVTGIPANGTQGVPVYVQLSEDPKCRLLVCPLFDEPASCPGGNFPPDPIAGSWANYPIGGAGGGVEYDTCDPAQFTISATGASKKKRDEQQFVYQELCGNGEIIARISDQTGIGWVGVEMRQDLSDAAPMVTLKRRRKSVYRGEYRLTSGGKTRFKQVHRSNRNWVRLVRNGNTFTGYTSKDGQHWSKVYSRTVSMTACIQVGLFAESRNDQQVTVGTFDQVTISTTPVAPKARPEESESSLSAAATVVSLDFDLFPNPAAERVNVDLFAFRDQAVALQLRSITGAVLLSRSIPAGGAGREVLELPRLPGGTYLVTVSSAAGQVTKKLIVTGRD